MTTEDKKITELYRSAEASEPPEHIDDVILSAARHAIQHKRHAYGPFSGHWPVLASVAALVIITVVIVPVIMQETAEQAVTGDPETMLNDTIDRLRMPEDSESMQRTRPPEPAGAGRAQSKTAPSAPVIMEQPPALTAPGEASDAESGAGAQPLSEQQAVKKEKPAPDSNRAVQGLSAEMTTPEPEAGVRQPEQWLQDIKKLIDENNIELARAELEKFRTHYPDYKIDPAILKLLTSSPRLPD